MSSQLLELFGENISEEGLDWDRIVADQYCPYLQKKCIKVRKSQPDVSIGSCSVIFGQNKQPIIICPHRLLQKHKIFLDCLHLLTLHEPGNELHVVSEIYIPGGSVDFALISANNGNVVDFVGIELQTLDTTGTVWPLRQEFLHSKDIGQFQPQANKGFGMNWKMTAKTILIQLHHKIDTFETLGKHLVLVTQDVLLSYMRKEFSFGHISKTAKLGDSMHFHSYSFSEGSTENRLNLRLSERCSTNSEGISKCLGLKAESNMELEAVLKVLESKISDATLLKI